MAKPSRNFGTGTFVRFIGYLVPSGKHKHGSGRSTMCKRFFQISPGNSQAYVPKAARPKLSGKTSPIKIPSYKSQLESSKLSIDILVYL
jgi:hypothetical protein